MKKYFFLMVALFSLTFAACDEQKQQETENAVLTITSSETIEVDHEGGTLEITYTLEGAKAGAKPTVSCNAEWITNIEVGSSITFNVEANDGAESRFTPIVISYGNSKSQVMLKQLSPSEAALNATFFGGEYYGSIYSPGMGNYFLHLSDNGFNEMGMDKPNSKYYTLDLYAPLYEGTDGGTIELPLGTYTLNTDSTNQLWTIGYDYSGYRESDADGASYDPLKYDNATLVVTEDGATFECSIGGTKHKVKFSGVATIIDARN